MVLEIDELESIIHVRHDAVNVDLAEDGEQISPELNDLLPVLKEIDNILDVLRHLLYLPFKVLGM